MTLSSGDYRARAEAAAVAWKRGTTTLPDKARGAAPYVRNGQPGGKAFDFCVPPDFATLNLLPDVRDSALALFAAEAIRWHEAVGDGPSNHLLDSQVQCVNALAPGIHDPGYVKALFGDVLPIDEVLQVEPERYLTFEYIGAEDYLGEGRGRPRRRGTMTTSADAAIRYRSASRAIELALIEWKFVEDYRPAAKAELSASRRPRAEIYRSLWNDPRSPLRHDVIPYEDLFVNPFYQLFRQQLLAGRMEETLELDASRVSVVHVAPAGNLGVRTTAHRPSHSSAGEDALKVWASVCRHPDRFISVDSARFTAAALGRTEYAQRYTVPT